MFDQQHVSPSRSIPAVFISVSFPSVDALFHFVALSHDASDEPACCSHVRKPERKLGPSSTVVVLVSTI